jgi:hypothetical protein
MRGREARKESGSRELIARVSADDDESKPSTEGKGNGEALDAVLVPVPVPGPGPVIGPEPGTRTGALDEGRPRASAAAICCNKPI